MESVDQKQAELAGVQWKLLQEQHTVLARDLAAVQQHVKDLQNDSCRALLEVERHLREGEARLKEECSLRAMLQDSVDQRCKRLRQDLDAEVKQRTNADANLGSRLEALDEIVRSRGQELDTRSHELTKLRDVCAAAARDMASMQEALGKESAERRVDHDATAATVRELGGRLQQEAKERSAADAEVLDVCRSSLDQHRSERELAHDALHSNLCEFQRNLDPHREKVPALHSRMQDLEHAVAARLAEQQRGLEASVGEQSGAQVRMQQRLAELTGTIERESAARTALAEEMEQVLCGHRTKLRNMVSDHTEATRIGQERLQSTVLEHLDRETRTWATNQEFLQGQLSAQASSYDARLQSLEGSLREVEERHAELRGLDERRLEGRHNNLSEEVAKQVRDACTTLQRRLDNERAEREAHAASLQGELEDLHQVFNDLRSVFLERLPQPRQQQRASSAAGRPAPRFAIPTSAEPATLPAAPRPGGMSVASLPAAPVAAAAAGAADTAPAGG